MRKLTTCLHVLITCSAFPNINHARYMNIRVCLASASHVCVDPVVDQGNELGVYMRQFTLSPVPFSRRIILCTTRRADCQVASNSELTSDTCFVFHRQPVCVIMGYHSSVFIPRQPPVSTANFLRRLHIFIPPQKRSGTCVYIRVPQGSRTEVGTRPHPIGPAPNLHTHSVCPPR